MSPVPVILCVGDCGVDRYVKGAEVGDLWGGCTLNVATSLKELGRENIQVRVATVLGDDAAGSELAAAIAARFPGSSVLSKQGATPVQRIELLVDGERQLVGYEQGVLSDWRFTSGQVAQIAAADYVHTLVFQQFEAAFLELVGTPRRGRLVVDFMDLSDYGMRLNLPGDVLRCVDVGFFGLSAGEQQVVNDLRELSRMRSNATYVATFGAAGSAAIRGGAVTECPAFPVSKVVDTTGAGDAFAAAFLVSSIGGAPLPVALAAASRHAATVVSRWGATPRFKESFKGPSPGSLS